MDRTLRREFPAPTASLRTAFTDPAALDVRPGGSYRIDGPGLGIALRGRYESVSDDRLVCT